MVVHILVPAVGRQSILWTCWIAREAEPDQQASHQQEILSQNKQTSKQMKNEKKNSGLLLT